MYLYVSDPVLRSAVQEACPGLRSLDLIVESDGGYEWLSGQQAKSLKSLRMACPEGLPKADRPLPLRLSHLHLLINHNVTLLTYQIQTLLYSSRKSLISLELNFCGRKTSSTRLRAFFATETFSNLRHPKISVDEDAEKSNHRLISSFIPLFPALESLILDSYDSASLTAIGVSATAGLKSLTLGHEFHLPCVGLDEIHKGDLHCPECTTSLGLNQALLKHKVVSLPNYL
ncbi:hypothetical protein RQP46_002623 [Phenoliferia psychrophenolica]